MSDSKTATTDAHYPAGTVAVATVRGVKGTRIFRTGSPAFGKWIAAELSAPMSLWLAADDVTDIRPLVVLDPESPEVREFVRAHVKGGEPKLCCSQPIADAIEAQTKPRRIPEPGLWGVVEAAVGAMNGKAEFVRHRDGKWYSDMQENIGWDDLIDPTLIREGLS